MLIYFWILVVKGLFETDLCFGLVTVYRYFGLVQSLISIGSGVFRGWFRVSLGLA